MVQMLQAETIRTPIVGSIQKRALRGSFGHNAFPTRRTADSSALSDAPREVENYQTKRSGSDHGKGEAHAETIYWTREFTLRRPAPFRGRAASAAIAGRPPRTGAAGAPTA